jgi:hypothetical protein
MPRDSSGNYTLPTGNPVVTGTVVSSSWANTTMTDIANVLTASLDRSGNGGMLVGFKLTDGTVGAPGLAFTNEPTTGLWRQSANTLGITIGGTNQITLTPTALTTLGQVVTLGAPTGGTGNTLIVNASSTAAGIRVVQAGSGNVYTASTSTNGVCFFASGAAATQLQALSLSQSGQTQWTLYQPASSNDLRFNNGTTDTFILNTSGTATHAGSSSSGAILTISNAQDSSVSFLSHGITHGIRFEHNSGGSTIDGVDSTGTASFQPITVQGTTVTLAIAGTAAGLGVNAAGGVSINPPTSGVALSVQCVAGGGIHSAQIADAGGNLFNAGFLEVPTVNVTANRTTVLSDSGKMVQMSATGTTQTIAANASVPYPLGTTLTFVNFSGGNTTIAINSDTLLFFGTGASGSRTLATGGRATAIKLTATIWGISGVNLT